MSSYVDLSRFALCFKAFFGALQLSQQDLAFTLLSLGTDGTDGTDGRVQVFLNFFYQNRI
jgi:hypothetical protein